MNYAPDQEFGLNRAMKMVAKDHKQRWVYRGRNGYTISDKPMPYKDKISVYWLPLHRAVACNWAPALLAHPAI